MLNSIFNFFHTYQPQPVIFRLGLFSIHWYGLLMVAAIFIGLFLTIKLIKKYGIEKEKIFDLALYLIIFGFVGARIYHILSEINYYRFHPLEIFYIWQGGLGSYGALIAGILVLYFYGRKHQLSFWLMADILTPAFVLGEAIVRWGNWFNQENFGRPTNQPWGIPIAWQNRPIEYLENEYFHPTFLYQSIWNLAIFIILLILAKKIKFGSGLILAIYCLTYSVCRFLIEFLRVNYQPMFLDLRLAQIMAILMFLFGIIIFFRKR